jgi:hypothetical protein
MAKTSVEGQGPPWAVEPLMMMMKKHIKGHAVA